jgi:NAD-dependent SIR2 family protein deacetylase
VSVDRLAGLVRGRQPCVVLTGAGISTDLREYGTIVLGS